MHNGRTGPSHVTRYNALALKGNVKQLASFHVFNNKCFVSTCMSTPGTISLFICFLSQISFGETITGPGWLVTYTCSTLVSACIDFITEGS